MKQTDEYFSEIAAVYDSMVLRAMPRYEEMLAELARCLPETATSVLELGCGTGRLTALLVAKYAGATITAVDAAPEMIDVARERIGSGEAVARLEFVVSTFEEFAAPDGSFDLVTSNMAIHHIIDKAPFYARLRKMLAPGGFFALGDELVAETPRIEALNYGDWLAFAKQPGHLTEAELAEIARHDAEYDHYETLRAQLKLLEATGFDPVDCVWRWRNYAVFAAEAGTGELP
jgi:ubiquinone/menaquinone biosynthesis C-methylase UbiE